MHIERRVLWVVVIMTMMGLAYEQLALGVARAALPTQSDSSTTSGDEGGGRDSSRADPADRLYGSWIANDVDTDMGEVTIKVVFRREGAVRVLAWSDIPFVGQVKDLKAPYEVHDDTISSQAIRGGTEARYSFEGERLVLRFEGGKVVRFDRE